MTAGGRDVRLLGCTCRGDPEAIKQAKADAIKAGYSNAAVGAIGRTPSDVFLFSKLPEADQQAILRQATPEEFDRYISHAHQKLRRPMRDEHVGNQAEELAPPPSPAPAPRTAASPPWPGATSHATSAIGAASAAEREVTGRRLAAREPVIGEVMQDCRRRGSSCLMRPQNSN
jgi:hypothetical protein